MKELQNVLKDLRKSKRISQQELANKLNITQQAYAHYENGTRSIPIETLITIADLFNISLDYLTGREENRIDTLSEDEVKILRNWNSLTERNKGKIELLMEQLLETQAEMKEVI